MQNFPRPQPSRSTATRAAHDSELEFRARNFLADRESDEFTALAKLAAKFAFQELSEERRLRELEHDHAARERRRARYTIADELRDRAQRFAHAIPIPGYELGWGEFAAAFAAQELDLAGLAQPSTKGELSAVLSRLIQILRGIVSRQECSHVLNIPPSSNHLCPVCSLLHRAHGLQEALERVPPQSV